MSFSQFKNLNKIPKEFDLDFPIVQNNTILNGTLVKCNNLTSVYSPICKNNNPILLGYIPEMGRKEITHSIESCFNSYNKGLGAWPSFSYIERINTIKKFTQELLKFKKSITTLLMWEIGKNTNRL